MDKAFIEKMENKMRKRRAYLLGQIDGIEDKFERSGDDILDGDSAEIRNLDVLDERDDMADREIRAIDAALDRIEAGTYGVCVKSGEDIAKDRLEAVPHTPFCAEHAP